MLPGFPPGIFPFWGPFPAVPPPAAPAAAPGASDAPRSSTEATQAAGKDTSCSPATNYPRQFSTPQKGKKQSQSI